MRDGRIHRQGMDASVGTARRTFTALRRVAAAALLAVTLAAASAGPASAAGEGEVNFQLGAGSWFDSYISGATSAQKTWMNDHYWRMRGFAPFFDQALPWAPEAHFYQDLYAIYRGDPRDEQLLQRAPRLGPARRQRQQALHPVRLRRHQLQPVRGRHRQPRVARVLDRLGARAHGRRATTGIFVDDVNLEMKVSNGAGNFVRPMDPRTGQPMTDAELAPLHGRVHREIRAAFPDKEIVHNSALVDGPQRSLRPAPDRRRRHDRDGARLQRRRHRRRHGQWSFRPTCPTSTGSTRGRSGHRSSPTASTATSATFEIASYFLVSNGDDSIVPDFQADPDQLVGGWDTDLGDALRRPLRLAGPAAARLHAAAWSWSTSPTQPRRRCRSRRLDLEGPHRRHGHVRHARRTPGPPS